MPLAPAHRPDDLPFDLALEHLVMPVGPGQYHRGAKAGGAGVGGIRSLQLIPCPGHGLHEIAARGRKGPVGGVNAGRAAKPIDLDPAVIGQRRKARGLDRRVGLDPGIADEGRLGLFGFIQPHFGGADTVDAVGLQQRGDLFQLPGIMGRHQKPLVGKDPHATAAFCASTRSATPASARSSSFVISSRENVAPSADICTSISRLRPVRMKLPSVPASLSSA